MVQLGNSTGLHLGKSMQVSNSSEELCGFENKVSLEHFLSLFQNAVTEAQGGVVDCSVYPLSLSLGKIS